MPGHPLDITLPTTGQATWSGPLNTALQTIIDDIEDDIEAAELYLNGDITLNPDGTSYSLNGARSIQLTDNSNVYSQSADIGRAYRYGSDLYFLDGDGNNIRITAAGAVNVTISGAVTNEHWSYSPANEQLTGTSTPGVASKLLIGDVAFRERVAGVTNTVTIRSPADLANSYTITLPTTAPEGADYFLKMDDAGDITHTDSPYFNEITVQGNAVVNAGLTVGATLTTTGASRLNGGATTTAGDLRLGAFTNNVVATHNLTVSGTTTLKDTLTAQDITAQTITGESIYSNNVALTSTGITSIDGIVLGLAGDNLNYYASGTYTPVFEIDGTPTVATYTEQTGTYTAIGDMVFVNIHVSFTTTEACSSKSLRFTLPFALPPDTSDMTDYAGVVGKMTAGTSSVLAERATIALIDSGVSSTRVYLRDRGGIATTFTLTTAALDIALSISYRRA